jgi:hypothetical protein
VGIDDFDSLFDLEKTLTEAVERESARCDTMYLGDLFEEKEEEQPKEVKRRGRPKGVKEAAPRSRAGKIKEIKERLSKYSKNLKSLCEIMG